MMWARRPEEGVIGFVGGVEFKTRLDRKWHGVNSSVVPRRTLVRSWIGSSRRTGRVQGAGVGVAASAVEDFTGKEKKDLWSGEWVGHEGRFSATSGKVIPLPNYYVPEEFAQWGIEPRGFESNNSVTLRARPSLSSAGSDGSEAVEEISTWIWRKHTRILPSVSMFADHVDVEEDVHEINVGEPGFSAFEDGSYFYGPSVLRCRESKLVLHPIFELVIQNPVKTESDQPERVLARFRFDVEGRRVDGDIQLILERFDMPFANGQFIEGGSGYRGGFTEDSPVDPADLSGYWKRSTPDAGVWTLTETSIPLCFPRGMYFIQNQDNDTGELLLGMGWVLEPGRQVVVVRRFDADGNTIESSREELRK
eukprot:CAMPEP_0184680162 /NCGR_PEP_ID=MMETSP0312-20130426/3049_1 /TAXON_ID=31354 /ORGANISM="Compsopogon coeruleus, Strain SAG 36.94" /LENGTH=364 /DNA_ID=CAMNT_0027130101 /DNA_START=106 /DNA_END=1200 /DNA_ORIENTATION=-